MSVHTMPQHSAAACGSERDVVIAACRAPSIQNTQPWRWRVAEGRIDLYADRSRQLRVADPDGRSMLLSCGAALHHARVAAAAGGFATEVERLPSGPDADHLATVHLTPAPVTPEALEAARVLWLRCTDRRRFTTWPVPRERLIQLAGQAGGAGAEAIALTEVAAMLRTALLVGRATAHQQEDDALRGEQRRWLATDAPNFVPRRALVGESNEGAAVSTSLAAPTGRRRSVSEPVMASDGLLVMATEHDNVMARFLAGEALSRMWLAATAGGLSVVPLGQVVEVEETRIALARMIDRVPQILVRVGWQQIGRHGLGRVPRRPLEEVLI